MDDLTIFFYLNGELSPYMWEKTQNWINNNPDEFKKIKLIWENSRSKKPKINPDLQSEWGKIQAGKNVNSTNKDWNFSNLKKVFSDFINHIFCISRNMNNR